MTDLLKDAVFAALGYTIGKKLSKSEVQEVVDSYMRTIDLRTCIEDYARAKGVYYRNQEFHNELLEIASYYEDPYSSLC